MSHPTVYPALRYEDADAAIDFLVEAFGFRVRARHDGPGGTVAHAELELGNGIVMLGSQRDDDLRTRVPRDVGRVTCSLYVVVDDVDAHYERAVAAGAEVVRPLHDTDYGSREHVVRDPEGHVWSFGTYDPYAAD